MLQTYLWRSKVQNYKDRIGPLHLLAINWLYLLFSAGSAVLQTWSSQWIESPIVRSTFQVLHEQIYIAQCTSSVFKIHDILVLIPIRGQIRIRGSVPLINGSDPPSRGQQKLFFVLSWRQGAPTTSLGKPLNRWLQPGCSCRTGRKARYAIPQSTYKLHVCPRGNGGSNIHPPGSKDSIEWLIEGQAFLRSYDSAPRPLHSPPISRQQLVSLCQSSPVACRAHWEKREEGEGVEPNHTTTKKPGPL